MAPSTRRTYASAQSKFISFCRQLGQLHPSGSPCPTDEWTLCLFVTFLARTLQHSSIKVYFSGIRALHIDQGFPDPLTDCLRLQRVVRGIKRCQGTSSSSRLPITDDLMLVIWRSLDVGRADHLMFWAACSLGYFGLLRTSEFTVPNLSSFSSSLHLSVQDVAVDSSSAPSSMRIRIKGSKTDPFRKGCFVHIGLGRHPLCSGYDVVSCFKRRYSGPLVSLYQWAASYSNWLDRLAQADHGCQPNSRKLLVAQFSHWSCHRRCSQWGAGSPHSNDGALVQQCLSAVH